MPGLTPEQARAVAHRGTAVVLASGAGCGKTHVLTARYLAHLRHDAAAVAQIVAVTFTDRAAREMRGRIRAAVAAEFAAAAPGSAAHARWRTHLRDLETAAITTLHGFAGDLLRRHAAAANLDPGFTVLDDALADGLRADAARDALHKLLLDPTPAGDDLRELVVEFGWAAVLDAVDEALPDPDPPGWAAWLARTPDDIAAEWAGPRRAELLAAAVARTCRRPAVLRCFAVLHTVTPPTPAGRASAAYIVLHTPQLHAHPDPAAGFAELRAHALYGAGGKKTWGADDGPAVRDALEGFRHELDKLKPLFAPPIKVREAAVVGQRFLRVTAAAHTAYQSRKRRDAALDFADLLAAARDLLRDSAEVRSACRGRFRYLLLDELQDTDPTQMELVKLLAGEALDLAQAFAVGDEKQSIYRFRGADVSLFRGLKTSVPAAGRMTLTRNYRSRPGVIAFVNALCRGWFPAEAELEPHRPPGGPAANVEFLWAVPGEDDADTDAAAARRREADAIARRIAELVSDPTPCVGDPPRPATAADVAILFRSMTNVAAYEAALRRHGLDYYLVGGRAFFAQQEVYDLLNLLRAVENPHDSSALVGVLRGPFANLTDDAIHLIGVHPAGPWAGLFDDDAFAKLPRDQQPAAARARRNLTAWRAAKDDLPLAGLLNRVFADSGFDAATQFEFLADRKLANLWKLIDLAREFDRGGQGLPAFVARLAEQVARQPREEQAATLPETADVVKLMSVHQAKGLEFPVVIVPDLGAMKAGGFRPAVRWHRGLGALPKLPADVLHTEREAGDVPFGDFPDTLGAFADRHADADEELRVLYVACTRARELLILSAGLPDAPTADPPGPWLAALAERYDLTTGLCKHGPGPAAKVQVVTPGTDPTPPPARPRPAGRATPAQELHVPPPRVVELRSPQTRLKAAVRRVIAKWDFADPDGWKEPLIDDLADVPDPPPAERITHALESFAASVLYAHLATAECVLHGVEFLADSGGGSIVRGVLDLAFRDAAGWHLVMIDIEGGGGDAWPDLAAAARAMQKSGVAPATVGLFDLITGEYRSEPAPRLRAEPG